MALPPQSSIASACRAFSDFLAQALRDRGATLKYLIGSPYDALRTQDSDHRLNFFFYRFEPSTSHIDALNTDTLWMRIWCLITALGVTEESVSAGENDLRLIGEVLRICHEQPVLGPFSAGSETYTLQLVQQPLSLDEVNSIWSTQRDTPYRPSVVYELAVAPVVPLVTTRSQPLVGSVTLELRTPQGGVSRTSEGPRFSALTVDASAEGWTPEICFVRAGICETSLTLASGSPAASAKLPVIVAGAIGADVELRWEVWSRDQGFTPSGAAIATKATTLAIDPATPVQASLQVEHAPVAGVGQALLYATRKYTRASDGAVLETRSHPLLVTVRSA